MAVTVDTFMYRRNFVAISNDNVEEAIQAVSAVWSGTQQFWASLDSVSRDLKRDYIMNLLVAWYLADMFPSELTGVTSNGGMPLSAKSIGGVDLKFLEIKTQEAMAPLLSNTFGIRALQMILSAPERFGIKGGQAYSLALS